MTPPGSPKPVSKRSSRVRKRGAFDAGPLVMKPATRRSCHPGVGSRLKTTLGSVSRWFGYLLRVRLGDPQHMAVMAVCVIVMSRYGVPPWVVGVFCGACGKRLLQGSYKSFFGHE